ncbi:phosphotransferase enzyme family protein [Nocardia carnea]|uniref:phosphotransferase enzyme family protein n=1 Tax=Nocardia carnea TaxID=37328 RepID=UPI00245403E2|nr:aminoglycoside phosphotransferase family protein [Nocardia carnea]
MQTARPFDYGTLTDVMTRACKRLGIDDNESQMARLGENAIYLFPGAGVMLRIGRSVETSRKEVAVASWLQENGILGSVPAVEEQPLLVEGYPVTVWGLIQDSRARPSGTDLGKVLRRLHALPEPTTFELPQFELMPKVTKRLAAFEGRFPPRTLQSLADRQREVEGGFDPAETTLGWGPIHGDAHIGNLMWARDGSVHLIDYEDFCIGPREWDLMPSAVGMLAGLSDPAEFQAMTEAYGYDVMDSPVFETLRAARELNMTTWLMQMKGHSADVDQEIERRLSDLREHPLRRRSWKAF